MNAQRDGACVPAAIAPDPLTSLRASARAIADLAFGGSVETLTPADGGGRHLALLTTDTLQLDLDDPAQRQFGDYELLEQIGEGGMGVVYRAHQRSLDRDVALKLLAAGPWASREFIERFRREAQHAARMQHPNIVAIHEVGSIEELQFFSMRLVRGGSLAALLKNEGALAPLRAAQMLRTIAEAVDYAHRLGVLHLDLKPANVLLDENGTPHVADFGLARRLDSALADGEDEISGTPSYMSPEQASPRSARITPATDIWGLGAILYEAVTGQPPFLGKSPHDTLRLVVDGSLRGPRKLVPDLSRDLEAIILKCMAHGIADRYPGARTLADDLGRFCEGRAVAARPLPVHQRVLRWARREPTLAVTAAAGVAALAIGLAATTQQWRRAEANAQAAATSATLASERLWQTRIDQAAVAVANGHSYDALPGLAANIKEREAQGLEVRDDRIRIATVQRSAPRLIDAIAMGSNIYGIAVSPDGKSVAVATEDEKLRLIDSATGKEQWQTTFADATHFFPGAFFKDRIRLTLLRFSADGRYLIGRNHPALPQAVSPVGYDEVLFDASDGKVLTPPGERIANFRDATYSPDGTYAIVRTTDAHMVSVRTADWQALGPFAPLDKAQPAWLVTTGGRHVLSSEPGFIDLSIRDPRTLRVEQTMKFALDQRMTAWASSADGESIVIGHIDGLIERVDCASGKREPVSPTPAGRIGWIAFSPDGGWFGAVADSGEVLVWDSATNRLAAPLMHLNTTPENHRDQLFVDAATRTVIASADTEMALWYLPDRVTAPVRMTGEFPNTNASWLRAFAYNPAQGLIATDGGAGELRIWRAPPLAPRGLHSAPLPTDLLQAGNGHIPIVEGAAVRVVNAQDGRAISPDLQLPQAAGFAELTADGASLAVLAGRWLYVYDVQTWTLRHSPIELPNDPARVALSPDSRHVLMLFADYRNGANGEAGQVWDLYGGTAMARAQGWEGFRVRFGPDGRNLLSWRGNLLRVLDPLTFQPRWPDLAIAAAAAGAGNAGAPETAAAATDLRIFDVHVAADGSRIDALTVTDRAASRVWHVDAATGAVLGSTPLSENGGAETFAMLPDRKALVMQRTDQFTSVWWDAGHGSKELPGYGGSELSALALGPDATMFARAPRMDWVALTSTRTLQWLTPPMPTAVPSPDLWREHPTHLAFTADAAGLVGRTRRGEWLYWDVRPDARPTAQIVRESARFDPGKASATHSIAAMLTDTERQDLRAGDPGPPLHVGGFLPRPIMPRQAGLPAHLFDLSTQYNMPLGGLPKEGYASSYLELAPGLHRFLGVDYDARGILALAVPGFAHEVNADRPPPREVRGIRPGLERFAALNLLMTAYSAVLSGEKHADAIVELDYVDGSRERLPILYRQDLLATWMAGSDNRSEPEPHLAWQMTNQGSPRSASWPSRIYAVRLANPHPERAVGSLALEATDEAFSTPLFFAISAEEQGASGPSVAAQ